MGNLLSEAWKIIAVQPIINVLLILSHYLFNNFGLAIVALTIISKAVLYPVNMKQMRTTKAMQDMQPKLLELQRRYARDRQRLSRETMALYKEAGVSPIGCAVPMLIQLPIMFALYQAISRILATFPEDFLNLSQYLYPVSIVYSRLPLPNGFLWLNLSVPDPYYLLPILTGVTMWVQQKQITTGTVPPEQQANQRMMLWMMPIMFAFITFSFPSGLALYWVFSSIISIGMQYFISGWGGLADIKNMRLSLPWSGTGTKKPVKRAPRLTSSVQSSSPAVSINPETSSELKEETADGEKTGETPASGEGASKGVPAPRRNPKKYKGRRPKGRKTRCDF